MSSVTDEMLVAYADGELDEVSRRRVERAIAQDAALAQRLEAHEALRSRIGAHYAPVAEEAVPDRFRAVLDAPPVIDLSAERERRREQAPRRGWAMVGTIAATLVLGVLIGRGMGGETGPIGTDGGRMVAQGTLADALNTQLASAGEVDGIRMGLTFKDRAGGWCRSFQGAAVSGVACRKDDGWRLEQALPGGTGQADYRQAASGDPRIAATVEALMSSAPVDATGEKAARDGGWD